jgi:exonuclease SbcD
MRILHTSDWHLGQSLHGVSRTDEHRHFLAWLVDTLYVERVDAVIVAGDIFDSANPPGDAVGLYFDFLDHARQRCPDLTIIIVGGNHDSATGLDAPARLLRRGQIHVVGSLPRTGTALDFERLLIPIPKDGAIQAWVVAVPFLRAQFLQDANAAYDADALCRCVKAVYAEAVCEAQSRCKPGQAIIATGHAYMVGARLSEDSERKIQCGNQLALPMDVIPAGVSYTALGHLHLAQVVAGRENIRYSGSPLPLALSERNYPHQVLLVDFDGQTVRSVRAVRAHRLVDILRIPEDGSLGVQEAMAALNALPPATAEPHKRPPYLEVDIQLAGPEPGIRAKIDEALRGKKAQLLKLRVSYLPQAGQVEAQCDLRELSAEEVFKLTYARKFTGNEPSPALKQAFAQLVEAAQHEQEQP